MKQTKCPNPIGVVKNESDGTLFELGCGKWSCPHCSKIKKNRLLDRVRVGFSGHRVRHFVLTELKGAGSKESDISLHWARLRASLAKYGFKGYKFFWTKEFAPLKGDMSPNPKLYRHMHLMISTYIPKSLIERLWLRATEETAGIVRQRDHGFVVHNPAGYLAKYMSKGFREAPFEKNERRYGLSRNAFPQLFCKLPQTWTVSLYQPDAAPPDPDGTVMYCGREDLEQNRSWYPNYVWIVAPEKLYDASYPTVD